ncbi:flagellar biosynthesis protein FlgN, partial [Treponema primitia]
MAEVLSTEEISRRVAILKRFREMLRAQRDRFQEYLNVLDKQQDVIEKGDTEALLSHVELEEHIVSDIFNIQKVINPLEDMYRAVTAQPGLPAEGDTEVS